MQTQKPMAPRPPAEKQPLIDEFNDLILDMMDGRKWTIPQRNAYNRLHRRIEAASNP